MKTKSQTSRPKPLTGEQIVQKKLDEVNAFLRTADLSKITSLAEKAHEEKQH